jgi:hypothetical protein
VKYAESALQVNSLEGLLHLVEAVFLKWDRYCPISEYHVLLMSDPLMLSLPLVFP